MPDSNGVRESRGMLRSSCLYRFVECITQEIVSGFWFDRDEAIDVLNTQNRLKSLAINLLGALNDRFRVG